jgi:hypothetical protein
MKKRWFGITVLPPASRPRLSQLRTGRGFSIKTTFRSCRQADAKLQSLLTTQQQILHALAASCVQSRQFFASTLPEQLILNLKMKLRIYAKQVLAINTKHGPTQSRKTVSLKVFSYSKFKVCFLTL